MSHSASSQRIVDFPATVVSATAYAETVDVPFSVVKGRGRPSTYRPEVLAMICGLIHASGLSERQAAALVGVARSTLSRWRTDDEEVALALDKARAEYLRDMMVNVREATTRDGRPEWRASAWLLQKLCPEEFGTPSQRERARAARERVEQEEMNREQAKKPRKANDEKCPENEMRSETSQASACPSETWARGAINTAPTASASVSSVPPCETPSHEKCPEIPLPSGAPLDFRSLTSDH